MNKTSILTIISIFTATFSANAALMIEKDYVKASTSFSHNILKFVGQDKISFQGNPAISLGYGFDFEKGFRTDLELSYDFYAKKHVTNGTDKTKHRVSKIALIAVSAPSVPMPAIIRTFSISLRSSLIKTHFEVVDPISIPK